MGRLGRVSQAGTAQIPAPGPPSSRGMDLAPRAHTPPAWGQDGWAAVVAGAGGAPRGVPRGAGASGRAGCIGRGSAEIQPGWSREPGAGSRSDDAGRSELCVRGLRELEGRPRWGCCCYWDYRGRCGGPGSSKVSEKCPPGSGEALSGWRFRNPRESRGPGQALGRVWESLRRKCPGTVNCS